MSGNLITFGLAYAGYLLLCGDVLLRTRRTPRRALTVLMFAVVATHVLLVWALRFGWSLDSALAKGPAGFVVFHGALAMLAGAAALREPWSGRLVLAAFPVVTAGALGAAFKYDFVSALRVPLLAALGLTVALGIGALRARGRRAVTG
ncbi:MAG: hypothetical protein L0216_12090 [Planctomycetales bacterium]|nr:hypothetical protein [Planctomycetales bacterium]